VIIKGPIITRFYGIANQGSLISLYSSTLADLRLKHSSGSLQVIVCSIKTYILSSVIHLAKIKTLGTKFDPENIEIVSLNLGILEEDLKHLEETA
jgi:hypothetical protein